MSEWVKIGNVSEFPPGAQKIVEVQGQEIALFNVDGTVYAVDNTCPHAGFPLGDGDISGDFIICPGHSFHYNLKTGECVNDPDQRVTCFPVKVEQSDILVSVSSG